MVLVTSLSLSLLPALLSPKLGAVLDLGGVPVLLVHFLSMLGTEVGVLVS